MQTLKIHLVAFLILAGLIILFLGLSSNYQCASYKETPDVGEFSLTGKSLENYSGGSLSIGTPSWKNNLQY